MYQKHYLILTTKTNNTKINEKITNVASPFLCRARPSEGLWKSLPEPANMTTCTGFRKYMKNKHVGKSQPTMSKIRNCTLKRKHRNLLDAQVGKLCNFATKTPAKRRPALKRLLGSIRLQLTVRLCQEYAMVSCVFG